MRILITSGGTREPIDGVRFITNFSSGSTGSFLADYFRERGHEVTLLRARDSKVPTRSGVNIEFQAFSDLEDSLKDVLSKKNFDAVFHLAAISDFSVDKIKAGNQTFSPSEGGKISSDIETVTLTLKRNHKLILKLRDFALQKDFLLVGFKLTNTRDQTQRAAAVEKISRHKDIDYVVHNDLSEISADGSHKTTLFKKGEPVAHCENKTQLAQKLEELLTQNKEKT